MDVVARRRGRPRKALVVPAVQVPRTALHAQAAARLKDMIVRGALPAGATLVETDLSAALGISRTPLREALKLLAAEGLVELHQNRSARVPDWTSEEILELFEALAGIERLTAELAAPRISEDLMDQLRGKQAQLDRMHRDQVLDGYFALNQEIHRTIVTAARNRPLAEAHAALQARAQWARLRALSSGSRWEESAREHRDLFEALAARDAAEAGSVAHRHVLRTGVVIAETLRARRADPAAR
ncbi:GntR family transcriptional regulator [Methylobacterium sp.]|uniref:GntR family transcriptional regulator n=1 Tax=Methylobacterium sp. TaxID=409 RepID=UPI000F99BA33|nr:GntR family transcriptional regulator [Methylobacterium sp.]RUP18572.1 MAG: GntR family transcriptional regulator [Methylobacterium sp.]